MLTHPVVVQNPVTDFNIWANDSVLYTPGEVYYLVPIGSSQAPLTNIHCNWDYNNRKQDYLYYDNINAGETYSRDVSFDRSYLGILNTTLNCSNLVSHLVKTVSTEIILDAVIIGTFETNGSVFLTNTTFFTANISRFGFAPRSCFHLDLGDGIQQVMFGLPICAPDATTLGIPFEQICAEIYDKKLCSMLLLKLPLNYNIDNFCNTLKEKMVIERLPKILIIILII